MTPAQKQALQYLAAACSDYANTLPPSIRGPFVHECQEALKILEATPGPPAVPVFDAVALPEPGENR